MHMEMTLHADYFVALATSLARPKLCLLATFSGLLISFTPSLTCSLVCYVCLLTHFVRSLAYLLVHLLAMFAGSLITSTTSRVG